MKTKLLLLLILFLSNFFNNSIAQQGSLKYLDEKRGYKGIILGNNITTIKSHVSLIGQDSIKKIGCWNVTDYSWLVVDDIVMDKVEIITKNDIIFAIDVKVYKKYSDDFFKVLKLAYGEKYKKISDLEEEYIWVGNKIILFYKLDYSRRVSQAFFYDKILYAKNEYKELEKAVKDL